MTALRRILAALLFVAFCLLIAQLSHARTAAAQADRAADQLAGIDRQLALITSLQSAIPDWARRTTPTLAQGGALTTAVNDCLAAAGLPASALASLSPAADTPITLGPSASGGRGTANSSAVRRRAVLTLAPVTLDQVGRVLGAWREAHPDWTITTIDLAPEAQGRRDAAVPPGGDLPLRAVVSIETLYTASSPSSPQAAARPGVAR